MQLSEVKTKDAVNGRSKKLNLVGLPLGPGLTATSLLRQPHY